MAYSNCSDSKANMLRKFYLALTLAVLLSGCVDDELYSGLSEKEANDMVSLLYSAGIDAKKTRSSDKTFTVNTTTENFAKSIEILNTNGFPRNSFESLGEVFKKEGFVSSPLEERARLNYAQSQELARTIESIDGVILARVHLAIPEENQLEDKNKPSSASVFIKHRRGIDLSDREAQIKALIVNSIEGLPYENVTVAMFTANPIPVPVVKHKTQEQFGFLTPETLRYSLILSVLLAAVLLFTTILLWIRNNRYANRLRISNNQT
jgi:type III secretion protein J